MRAARAGEPILQSRPGLVPPAAGGHRHARGDHCLTGRDLGAFSVTQQAIQLGFMPRLRIAHTSASTAGQIYIPLINWGLMVAVILLVLRFETSSNLTAAYGIAVTGAMFIDNVLLTVVLFKLWNWSRWLSLPLLGAFYLVDGAYLAANLTKIPYGGWVPLAIGLVIFTLLTTWSKGRALMMARLREVRHADPGLRRLGRQQRGARFRARRCS